MITLKLVQKTVCCFRARSIDRTIAIIGGKRFRAVWDTGNLLTTSEGDPVHVICSDVEPAYVQRTGRLIEVKTVADSYVCELVILPELRVLGEGIFENAFAVFSNQNTGAIQVILNEAARQNAGGKTDEKLLCKADKKLVE